MTTTPLSWSISAIGSLEVHDAGTAATMIDLWTAALRSARNALLGGQLDNIAVTVDGQLDALYDPGRDDAGGLEPTAVTASLVDLHQAAIADELTDRLVKGRE